MTSYGALKTVGPSLTVKIPDSGKALVTITTSVLSTSYQVPCGTGFTVSGATTAAASDVQALIRSSNGVSYPERQSATYLVTGLNAGSNTFTLQYKIQVAGFSCTFSDRNIVVIPWPN